MPDNRMVEWVSLPTTLASLSQVAEIIECVLSQVDGVQNREAITYNVVLAAHELFANIVTHGYGETQGTIRVRLQMDTMANRLTLDTYDDAPQVFDSSAWQPPDLDEPQEHGLGVWLIYQLMDEVIYRPSPGANHWRLIKEIPRF